jgi:hypothetical protein
VFADLHDGVKRTVTLADDPFLANPVNHSIYAEAYGRYRALFDGVEGALS